MLPDGTVVETWYNFNNHTCKVTVPGVPTKPVEAYIPGIVMAPMDDTGKWGYGTPFSDPLGTACPTYDIVKFGSSLLTPAYAPGTTDYDHSNIIRPWKQPTVDPVASDYSFSVGQYAHPMYNNAEHEKYIGNMVLPGGSKNYGLLNGKIPAMGLTEYGTETRDSEYLIDRNDGYRLLERIRQASSGAAFFKGIPKAYCGVGTFSYYDRYVDGTRHDLITYSKTSIGVPEPNVLEGFYSAGSYDITEHGKYTTDYTGIIVATNRDVALDQVTISDIYCIYVDYYGETSGYGTIGQIQLTDRYFMVYYTYPGSTKDDIYNNAINIMWKMYRYDEDFTAVSLVSTYDYPWMNASVTMGAWDGTPDLDISVSPVTDRILLYGHTYLGEVRTLTASYSNMTYVGTAGEMMGTYNVDIAYSMPDGAGGTTLIELNCSAVDNECHHETLQHILWDAHTDCYIYAIIYTDLVYPGYGAFYDVSGTITLYHNGTSFYSYTLTSTSMLLSSFELPWVGPNMMFNFRKVEEIFLGWFTGVRGPVPDFDPAQEYSTFDIKFNTPTADKFIYWLQESDVENQNSIIYTIDCRSIVDPGKDTASSNKVVYLSMKELEEGNMANTDFVRFSWWNNAIVDGKSIEEMLLIDAKTNPRITNFGVI
jgi:hypothetical protein